MVSRSSAKGSAGRVRLVVVQALVLSLFLTLFARLWYMQVLTGDTYHARAVEQSVRDVVVQPPRGLIVVLGTTGLLMRGSEELKGKVLPSIAAGEATASYALSEREAGSDAGAMRTRAVADGDDWILNGTKCWISNGGKSTWYTVMAVTDPD